MKKIFTSVFLFVGSLCVFAQQDPQFTQFMHNKLFMNPAYAGMRQALCVSAIYRNQWNGLDGAPNSGVFSADMTLPRYSSGIGISIMHDKLGFESTSGYNLKYSFHRQIGPGILGIGAELGAYSKRIGPTGSDQWVATTNWQIDNTIPPQLKHTVADFGFGLWYQASQFWFGISSSHLNSKMINDGQSSPMGNPPTIHNLAFKVARHYFITGGVKLNEGGRWEVRPSFLVKTDATVTSFDLNVLALFDQRFWFAASYRYKDAICPMVGVQFSNNRTAWQDDGLKIGFAYDYTTSKLKTYNNGSFEIFLNYCIPIKFDPKKTGHGCPRFFE